MIQNKFRCSLLKDILIDGTILLALATGAVALKHSFQPEHLRNSRINEVEYGESIRLTPELKQTLSTVINRQELEKNPLCRLELTSYEVDSHLCYNTPPQARATLTLPYSRIRLTVGDIDRLNILDYYINPDGKANYISLDNHVDPQTGRIGDFSQTRNWKSVRSQVGYSNTSDKELGEAGQKLLEYAVQRTAEKTKWKPAKHFPVQRIYCHKE